MYKINTSRLQYVGDAVAIGKRMGRYADWLILS